MKTLRVYVTGKLRGFTAEEYLRNISRMIKTGERLRKRGISPYLPCLDLLLGIVSGQMHYRDYINLNLPWLRVSDAVLVIERSPGTDEEIAMAIRLNIPVYHDEKVLLDWANEQVAKMEEADK